MLFLTPSDLSGGGNTLCNLMFDSVGHLVSLQRSQEWHTMHGTTGYRDVLFLSIVIAVSTWTSAVRVFACTHRNTH